MTEQNRNSGDKKGGGVTKQKADAAYEEKIWSRHEIDISLSLNVS